MLENVLIAAPPGDNARGGAACPPWLFLFDRLDPGRVLSVDAPDLPGQRWLREHATEVRVITAGALLDGSHDDPLPPASFDIIHIGNDGGSVLADDAALARLRAAASPEAQLWAPAANGEDAVRRLRRAGFERIRWVDAAGSPRSLMTAAADLDPATTRFLSGPARRGPRSRIADALRTPPGLSSLRRRHRRPGRMASARTALVASLAGTDTGPPRYVTDLAQQAGLDLAAYRCSVWARGGYPSQKAVIFLFGPGGTAPDVVVKVTKDPRFNARLDNEHRTLVRLASAGGEAASRAPEPLFHGSSGGLAVVGQAAVHGKPFVDVSALTAECPVAADAVDGIIGLGCATTCPVAASSVAEPLDEVLVRFCQLFAPSAAAQAFLQRQVGIIGGRDELPAVLLHGDLGTWNVLVNDGGRATMLDWEAAEQPGPPLWDLAYFLRSYAVQGARRQLGPDRRLRVLSRHFLAVSSLTSVAAQWLRRYRHAVGLDRDLMAPLFHTCWMHRAVKEAARLPVGRRGHYADLCLLLAERQDAPGLRMLLEGDDRG